jgi:hypothetical protein
VCECGYLYSARLARLDDVLLTALRPCVQGLPCCICSLAAFIVPLLRLAFARQQLPSKVPCCGQTQKGFGSPNAVSVLA